MEAIKMNELEELEAKASEETKTNEDSIITVEEPKKSKKGWIIAGVVAGVAAIAGGIALVAGNKKTNQTYLDSYGDDNFTDTDNSEGYDKFVEDASENSEN